MALVSTMEKLLTHRDMAKGQCLARREVFIRETGEMGKNTGRESGTVAKTKFFILVSGVLRKAPPIVKPMGKENGSTVKSVTYMKETFVAQFGRVRERCITGMEIFIEENGVTIKNMVSER